ncbi:MAG: nucleotidyltransferase [Bacteroidetes bacterium]|nr:MAG: nucleotidyltransferase [Bacteroidota bacterium]
MLTLADITATLQAHLPRLRRHYHVETLGIFGSHVRGEPVEGSDVDLLVTFSQTPTLFEFVALKQHLEALLGCPVDLGMPEALKPPVAERILQETVYV